VIEGEHDIDERFTRERISDFKDELDDMDIDSMRLYYNLVELPAYKNIARIFELYTSTIDDLGPLEPEVVEEVREKLGL